MLKIIILCILLLNTTNKIICYNNDEILIEPKCSDIKRDEIELHLSTKTPYRVIANLNDSQLNYPGCHATRIWSVIRHGTRYPSKKVINEAKEKLFELKKKILDDNANTRLCSNELANLQFWYFNINVEEEKYLVAEGEDELIELAERMQNRFPYLLPDFYDPQLYYFKYTATQRTFKSAQSFATGLFGRHHLGEIQYPEALYRDPVLRFYKLCNRWKIDVDKNPTTFKFVDKFLEGPEMQIAIEYIKSRTQINNITARDAQLIYTICAFETAWNRHRSPSVWCNLFNRETIRTLEFAEDLEYYWNDGYGYELTYKIACPAIEDMFKLIDPNSKKPNATFYFTHSGTLLKMLAHLGLYKDKETLTHNDFKRQRLWRTSAIDAFASNIAFVLYECKNDEPMVLTLHQERPVRIPGCPQDSDLCSLRNLRQIFSNSLKNCNFDAICYI